MPLFTEDITQARVAYSALEVRTSSAELRVAALQSHVDQLQAAQPISLAQARVLRQATVDSTGENAQLRGQQINQVSPDATLQSFIAAVGLAAAVGEATMPDRVLPSIGVSLQSYLTVANAQVSIRLHQPELRDSVGLSTASFQLIKVPPQTGTPAPRNLYKIFEDVQTLYANPFWTPFVQGTPPAPIAPGIVLAASQILAATGDWTFPFLVQAIAAMASTMKSLAALVLQARPGPVAVANSRAADALIALAAALANKAIPVSGDLFALSAALDAVIGTGRLLLP